MAKSKSNSVNVSMKFVRATKNFLRYEGDEDGPMPTLYVRKDALEGQPKAVRVTVVGA